MTLSKQEFEEKLSGIIYYGGFTDTVQEELLKQLFIEVIGEDDKPQLHTDPDTNARYYLTEKVSHRNELRAELHKIVKGEE